MGLTVAEGKGGWLGSTLHTFPSAMAQNFWLSLIAWTVCFVVTILVSMMTAPKPVSELANLVWGETKIPKDTGRESLVPQSRTLAVIVVVICIILNLYFR